MQTLIFDDFNGSWEGGMVLNSKDVNDPANLGKPLRVSMIWEGQNLSSLWFLCGTASVLTSHYVRVDITGVLEYNLTTSTYEPSETLQVLETSKYLSQRDAYGSYQNSFNVQINPNNTWGVGWVLIEYSLTQNLIARTQLNEFVYKAIRNLQPVPIHTTHQIVGYDKKYYQIARTPGKNLIINWDLAGTGFIYFYDSKGSLLTSQYAIGNSIEACYVYPASNSDEICLELFNQNYWSISARFDVIEVTYDPTPLPSTDIEYGQTINKNLSNSSPLFTYRNTKGESFRFLGSANDYVILAFSLVSGPAFHHYIYLTDASGNILAEALDSDIWGPARIYHYLPTDGYYYVVCCYYSPSTYYSSTFSLTLTKY